MLHARGAAPLASSEPLRNVSLLREVLGECPRRGALRQQAFEETLDLLGRLDAAERRLAEIEARRLR
jgi:hypothetical protein